MYYTANMIEKPQTRRASGLLSVDLGEELKSSWYQWCASRKLIPGKAVRSLIEIKLQEEQGQPSLTAVVQMGSASDHGQKIGHEIYFTPSEHQVLLAVAKIEGYGLHEFVIASVRAALAKAPAYGQMELEALTRSNAALVTVLMHLVAIRREVQDEAIAGRLNALENDVRAHIECVSQSMAAGVRRWKLEV